MERRNFLKSSCLACGAMGLAAVFGSSFLESCSTASMVKGQNVDGHVSLDTKAFEDGQPHIVRVANYDFDLVVQKKSNAAYLVMPLVCTHAGYPLTKTGNSYYCTLHGSRFDSDGKVLKGPASIPMKHLTSVLNNQQLNINLNA